MVFSFSRTICFLIVTVLTGIRLVLFVNFFVKLFILNSSHKMIFGILSTLEVTQILYPPILSQKAATFLSANKLTSGFMLLFLVAVQYMDLI